MNINTVRVKVNSEAQMRIAMTLLQEISGKKPYNNLTIDQYISEYPHGEGTSVGINYDNIASWSSAKIGNISFSDFVIEAAKLLEEEQIKIDKHTVEFKSNGVQVGCTFVSKDIVEKIYKKLFP